MTDIRQVQNFHLTLRQIFQINFNYLQKSQLIDRLQTNEELESNCILLISQKDYFEQKYNFASKNEEVFKYSGFNCKIKQRNSNHIDSSNLPVQNFVSKNWDYFKLRIFTLLFASQSLVYDVIDIMEEESAIEQSPDQHRQLYFYALMGTN